jgi:predicted nuclease of predicted toxin-antitoxin system
VIRLLADENFNAHILKGLADCVSMLDLVRARDVGLVATPDPAILEWAAARGRVLLTHDRQTIPAFARSRITASAPMPGNFLVSDDMPTGEAIEEIQIAVHCLSEDECQNAIKYSPM